MKFNNSQIKAIKHKDGPVLVLAGPGSGKTTVIIKRISHLITVHNIPPENILAVTFTRASANEMSDRFRSSFSSSSAPAVEFGTFHSIFLKILKDSCKVNLKIIKDTEKFSFISSEILAQGITYESLSESTREILLSISKYKSSGIIHSNLSDDVFLRIFGKYQDFMSEEGLLDFDDIIIRFHEMLKNDPALRQKLQKRFTHILIDEFQDISPLQYEAIKLLAGSNANLFIVGDDDQSIYGFRGSSPDIIKQFKADFPGCETILLNINYRCEKLIFDAASAVIRIDKDRIDKEIRPLHNSLLRPANDIFGIGHFPDRKTEYEYIIKDLKAMLVSGDSQAAVLFRNNADSLLFTHMLKSENIPFDCPGMSREFSGFFQVNDILCYLKASVLLNSADDRQLTRNILKIMNKPSRFISRDALVGRGNCFALMRSFYSGNTTILKNVSDFHEQLSFISTLSPYAAVKYIRNAVGYDFWLKERAGNKSEDFQEYAAILDDFEEYAATFAGIELLLKDVQQTVQERPPSGTDLPVRVMTMHSSKGLEFDRVYIPDANDNIIPNKKAAKEGSENEERRLLYVAMTRTRSSLYISYVDEMHNVRQSPSRFLCPLIR